MKKRKKPEDLLLKAVLPENEFSEIFEHDFLTDGHRKRLTDAGLKRTGLYQEKETDAVVIKEERRKFSLIKSVLSAAAVSAAVFSVLLFMNGNAPDNSSPAAGNYPPEEDAVVYDKQDEGLKITVNDTEMRTVCTVYTGKENIQSLLFSDDCLYYCASDSMNNYLSVSKADRRTGEILDTEVIAPQGQVRAMYEINGKIAVYYSTDEKPVEQKYYYTGNGLEWDEKYFHGMESITDYRDTAGVFAADSRVYHFYRTGDDTMKLMITDYDSEGGTGISFMETKVSAESRLYGMLTVNGTAYLLTDRDEYREVCSGVCTLRLDTDKSCGSVFQIIQDQTETYDTFFYALTSSGSIVMYHCDSGHKITCKGTVGLCSEGTPFVCTADESGWAYSVK